MISIMEIKLIRTKKDYRAALREIETLMSARADTLQGKRLDILVRLVEAYENPRSAGMRPIEVYSEKRIGEFDKAETDLEKALSQQEKSAR